MSVPLSDVVFAFDMNRLFTEGGNTFLYDYGPSGFHFQFGAGAAAPTPQLDGSLSFDGGDYLSLPAARLAEFYARMPTREYTFLLSGRHADTAANAVAFSCSNAGALGVWLGLAFQATPDGRLNQLIGQGGAALPNATLASPSLIPNRSRVIVATNETTPRALVDQQTATVAWAVGAFGTASYGAAVVPQIGTSGFGQSWIGPMRYAAIIRGAISSPDLSQLSRMLSEGLKPFCVRQ